MSDTGQFPPHHGRRPASRPRSVAAASLPDLAAPEETVSKSDTLAVLKRLRSVRERGRDNGKPRGLAAFLPSRLFEQANRHAEDAGPEDEPQPSSPLGDAAAAPPPGGVRKEVGHSDAESTDAPSDPPRTADASAAGMLAPDDLPVPGWAALTNPVDIADGPHGRPHTEIMDTPDDADEDPEAPAPVIVNHGANGALVDRHGDAVGADATPADADAPSAPESDEGDMTGEAGRDPAEAVTSFLEDDGADRDMWDAPDHWDEPPAADTDLSEAAQDGHWPPANGAPDRAGAEDRASDDWADAGWNVTAPRYGDDDIPAGEAGDAETASAPGDLGETPADEDTPDAAMAQVDDMAAAGPRAEPEAGDLAHRADDAADGSDPQRPVDTAGAGTATDLEPQATAPEGSDRAETEQAVADAEALLNDVVLQVALDDDGPDADTRTDAGDAASTDPDEPVIRDAGQTVDDHAPHDETEAADLAHGPERPADDAGTETDEDTQDGHDAWDRLVAAAMNDRDEPPAPTDAGPEATLDAEDPVATDTQAGEAIAPPTHASDAADDPWSEAVRAFAVDAGAEDTAGEPDALDERSDAGPDTGRWDASLVAFARDGGTPDALGTASGDDGQPDDTADAAIPAGIETTDREASIPASHDDSEHAGTRASEAEAVTPAGAAFEHVTDAIDAQDPETDMHAGPASPLDAADAEPPHLDDIGHPTGLGPDAAELLSEAADEEPATAPTDGQTAPDAEPEVLFAGSPEADAAEPDRPWHGGMHAHDEMQEEPPFVEEETFGADPDDAAAAEFDGPQAGAQDDDPSGAEWDEDASAPDPQTGSETDRWPDDEHPTADATEATGADPDEPETATTDAELGGAPESLAFAASGDEADEAGSPAHETGPPLPAVPADMRPADALDTPDRKPRIALMGEFSAGKSTLSNLLIGSNPLPTKVTATQLPPIWISWGDGPAYREDLDGGTHPITLDQLAQIDPAETRMVRIFQKSETLELCDIIDMPGISDPNMETEVWERMIGKADAVIWCTHATQAWRQSEAAVWETLDPKLRKTSLLLVTRFDKLVSEKDRSRVLKRIRRETEGQFRARLPIALLDALSSREDPGKWTASGAEAFTGELISLLNDLSAGLGQPRRARPDRPLSQFAPRHAGVDDDPAGETGTDDTDPRQPSRIAPRRIVPRRVSSEAAGHLPPPQGEP